MRTCEIIFVLEANRGWNLYQFDVNSAFLYGNLDELVLMNLPSRYGFIFRMNIVCGLNKAIYGLSKHHHSGVRNFFGDD